MSSNDWNEDISLLVQEEMRKAAEEMEVKNGVGIILVDRGDENSRVEYFVLNSIERDPDPNRGNDDMGANYFAVVMAKLAVMLSTGLDSGQPDREYKFGEVSYRGGIITPVKGGKVYVAFSGGTEDQDVEISRVGMDYLVPLLVN